VIEFGPFRYDSKSRLLYRGEEEAPLPPRVVAVLESLLERPGEIVPKEEILASAWEGAFVGEDSLTQAISQLRGALGDDPGRPEYIQTIPKRGYRFIAEVAEPLGGGGSMPLGERAAVGDGARPFMSRHRTVTFGLVAVLAFLALGALAVMLSRTSEPSLAVSRPVPLTSYPGSETEPALSPDGQWVAFIADGGERGVRRLYVKSVAGGADEPRPLTDGTVHDHSPTWSPDGTRIAFVREAEGGMNEVRVVSLIGGETTHLGATYGDEEHRFGLSWSPDEDFLALVYRESPDDPNAIFLLDISTGENERVTSPPTTGDRPVGDGRPAFSPDGGSIAFIRFHGGSGGGGDLYVQPLGGDEKFLYAPPVFAWDVDWASDGEAVVMSAGTTFANSWLVSVPVDGGAPTELPFGDRAQHLSIARETGRLAYSVRLRDINIWRVSGPTAETRTPPKQWIASTFHDDFATYSPDGRKIAFVSDRDGTFELWISAADGRRAQRLTNFGHVLAPRWSPTGGRIVFHSAGPGGQSSVYTIDARGGVPVKLPFGEIDDSAPAWSADERWIYLQSQSPDDFQIWKVPLEGDEEPVHLTGGMFPREGPNGRVFY